MRYTTRTIGLAALAAAALFGTAGCSDDDQDEANDAASGDTSGESVTTETIDALAGSFELTTADGTISIAGIVEDCTLIDQGSASITFSGSSQEVTVEASDGTGSVTVLDQFEGTIDTAAIDTEIGDVLITGTGSAGGDTSQSTEFQVSGTCEV